MLFFFIFRFNYYFMKRICLLIGCCFFMINSFEQNVGIGTITPFSKLHIKGGLLLDSTNGSTPVSGPGTRLMWILAKSSFRAGYFNGTHWDDANIGSYSFATGQCSVASGNTSTAMDGFTTASGNYSTAMGESTTASGVVSTAMGWATTASGDASTAMGYLTTSKSYAGFTAGLYNDSSNAASATTIN
jgi:hypothetical protein